MEENNIRAGANLIGHNLFSIQSNHNLVVLYAQQKVLLI